MMDQSDVIAAIATPPGRGGIGVVRLSGDGALDVLARIFETKRDARRLPSHTLHYGYIHDNGQRLDEVMCGVMRAPRSYTRENVVEIYCHGGMMTLRGVLEAALKNGARPAEPGEFTKRAFLNGRIDLTQAEAVMELINAKTQYAQKAGLRRLGGGLSEMIKAFREIILHWLAHIELSIDYPEHASEAMNIAIIQTECADLLQDMRVLMDTAQVGRVITEGVKTVIMGRPNVGKSSLMNAILQEERAIVTEIPGTTRDVLSETVNIRQVPVTLLDTAGIRPTEDAIERLGVNRSMEQAQNAELVLVVLDYSQSLTEDDYRVIELAQGKPSIVLLNKCDLPPADDFDDALLKEFPHVIKISAKNRIGLDKLYQTIEALFLAGKVLPEEEDILTHTRHKYLLEQAIHQLEQALSAIKMGVPEDMVSIDLRIAYETLGEIIGETVGEDVIDRIFSEFCVGK